MYLRGVVAAVCFILAACTNEGTDSGTAAKIEQTAPAPTDSLPKDGAAQPESAGPSTAAAKPAENDPLSLIGLYARKVSGGYAFPSRYHYNEWRLVAGLRGERPEKIESAAGERYRLTIEQSAPKLVILIDDLGNARWALRRIAALGFPVNGAVLPFTPFAGYATEAIRKTGGDVILHAPLEPVAFPRANPGPGALFVTMATDALTRAALDAWGAVPGRIGLNNHMGSRFTSDIASMATLAGAVKELSPVFIDSRTSPGSVAMKQMATRGIPSLGRTHFLDESPTFWDVGLQLNKAIRYARRNGVAVAIGHPHEATIRVLEKAGSHLRKAGVEAVGLRSLFSHAERTEPHSDLEK